MKWYFPLHLICYLIIIPPLQRSWKRGILVSRRPSVCSPVCPFVRPSVDKIVSALYLPQFLPDPFHDCTSYQATSEGVSRVKVFVKFQNLNFWHFFGICNFDFVLLWHGIWYESIIWVIMGRWGVFAERRRSSCSSWFKELYELLWCF